MNVAYAFATSSSQAYNDATTQFEEWVQEYLDRIEENKAEIVRLGAFIVREAVHSFQLLLDADEEYRRNLYEDRIQPNLEIESQLRRILENWITSSDRTDNAIKIARKYDVLPEIDRYFECVTEAKAMLKALDGNDGEMTEPLRQLRDEALKEHQRGETAELL